MDDLQQEIRRLKQERRALILVHNYQRPEVQEIADFLGDSLDLSLKACEATEETIVFCGVSFMAESAKILNPHKTVLLPREEATCQLADSAAAGSVRQLKQQHPEALVIAYINTYADVKAEADICCTSANALSILRAFPDRELIYLPDGNLARYAEQLLGRPLIKWPGACYVHDRLITPSRIQRLREQHPGARVMAHPECPLSVLGLADHILGTGSMVKLARESSEREFIVATETGLVTRLQRENPDKVFYPVEQALCATMKLTALEDVRDALLKQQHRVELDPDVMQRARRSLERMLEFRA
jgi:quinolinate synthase